MEKMSETATLDENTNDNMNELSIDDQLFFETLYIMVRGETIKYSSHKKT